MLVSHIASIHTSRRGRINSQLCCVEGEKEKERMMQNEDKTRFFIIVMVQNEVTPHKQCEFRGLENLKMHDIKGRRPLENRMF